MSTALLGIATVALGLVGRARLTRTRPGVEHEPLGPRAVDAHGDWPAFLDAVAEGVRGGHSLREAFAGAAPRIPPTAHACTAATPLHVVPTLAMPHEADEAVVLQTLSVALSLGGSTAAVLQSGAALLRERAAVRAEAAAHAAQARLSARVLTAVPLVFATWGALASASFRASLVGPFGVAAATAGLALNAVGWWWMRCIVRRAAR